MYQKYFFFISLFIILIYPNYSQGIATNNVKDIPLDQIEILNQKVLPHSKIEMIQSFNDQLIIAGIFNKKGKQNLFIGKMNHQFNLDHDFGKKGLVILKKSFHDKLFGLGIDSKNRILISGSSLKNHYHQSYVARLNTNGKIDKTFGNEGFFFFDLAGHNESHYLQLTENDAIIITGFYQHQRATHGYIAKINPDGKLDHQFADHGIYYFKNSSKDHFFGLILHENKIFATGSTQVNQIDQIVIVSLEMKGTLNSNFGQQGIKIISLPTLQNITAAIIGEKNYLYLTGFSTQSKTNTDVFVIKITTDGMLDLNFGQQGKKFFDINQKIDNAHSLVIHHENLWITGEFHQTSKNTYHPDGILLIRIPLMDSNNSKIFTTTDKLKSPVGINSMIIDKNGVIWLGGFHQNHFTLAGINQLK